MRIPAYTAVAVLLATVAFPASATARPGTVTGPGATAHPAVAHGGARFDQPYTDFAPADTVLHGSTPEHAGLDPATIAAYERQLATWENPASGTNYLFPGATTLMVHEGEVVERSATGYAVKYADATTELPRDQWVPARQDTIYDMASVSKLFTSVVAVQQLEAGRIDLQTPVAHYLPGFAAGGKDTITIRQLLTHTSGLDADPVPSLWAGYPDVPSRVQAILDSKPIHPPGTTYLYSDINLMALQLVLEKVTGKPLDALVRDGITQPLRLTDTGYNPPAAKLGRIAATEYEAAPPRGMVRGSVHDENAWSLNGVAGHAGVFSTADDLAVLAQTILNGGVYQGHRILSEHGVTLMEQNFNQDFPGDSHGLGFELDQIWYMGGLSGPQTLGHTGYTGTSLVIDPASRSFVILLTNRVHPTRNTPSTNPARREIAQALAKAIPLGTPGSGPSWYANQPGGTTSTLTTGELAASGPVDIAFSAFVNTESTDPVHLEASTDGGGTWARLPMRVTGAGAPSGEVISLSGQDARAWWQVHAQLPQAQDGLLLRWRYTTDSVYEGRGVNLTGLTVTDASGVLLDSNRPDAALTAAGWQPIAGDRRS